MRFGQSIRLNSNPRWWGYYVPYEQLKTRLGRLHKLHTSRFVHSPSNSDDYLSGTGDRSRRSARSRGRNARRRLPSDVERASEADDEDEEGEEDEDSSNDERDEQSQRDVRDGRPSTVESVTEKAVRKSVQPREDFYPARPLQRTASDAVLFNYPSADSPNRDLPPSSTFPAPSLEKKIRVPIVGIDSSESAAILFEQEDELFFRHLKDSVRIADDFYERMLVSLHRHVDGCQKEVDSIKRLKQKIQDYEIHRGALPPPYRQHGSRPPSRNNPANESSPLLSSIVINSGGGQNDSHPSVVPVAEGTEKPHFRIDVKGKRHLEDQLSKRQEELLNDCNYLFQEVYSTVNFAILNVQAIEKILKKHDKLLGADTKAELLAYFGDTSPLYDLTELEALSSQLIRIYADMFENGDEESAKKKLCYGLPEHVFWTRGTYWGENLKANFKSSQMHNVRGVVSSAKGIIRTDRDALLLVKGKEATKKAAPAEVRTGFLLGAFCLFLIFALTPKILLLVIGDEVASKFDPHVLRAANRALALLLLCVICWAWKVIPLYATSFLVFAAASSMRIFIDKDTGMVLNGHDASSLVVQEIGSPTVLLILCVYSLASALKKCQIDRIIAINMMKVFRPSGASLVTFVMVLSIVVSMTISNIASPVLLVSVMRDSFVAFSLRGEGNKKFVRGLLFAIMIACNIGGFVSPIASPQAAVAIGLLSQGEYHMSFGLWLLVMVPLAVIMLGVAYIFLLKVYHENEHIGRIESDQVSKPEVKYSWNHYGTIGTLLLTILMWLVPWFTMAFGSTGIIGTLPICIIFGSGILEKSDFMNLAWDVVILVAGGSVLGAAVHSSRLLDMLADRLMQVIGAHAIVSFVTLCSITTLISVFVSHTVSSIILLPLFLRVGDGFGQPYLFVLGGTAAASCGMATNVASFPNLTISELQDDKKEYYIESGEFKNVGAAMTLGCLVVLAVLGSGWILVMG